MKNLKQNSMVLAIVMLIAFTANAQQNNQYKGKNGRQGQGYGQKHCSQNEGKGLYLDLSDEQKTQIDKLRLDIQKKILPLKNELDEKKAKMKTLNTAENVDMKAINALIDDIGKLKTQMTKEKASHRQEVRKILTEEQRIKFDLRQGTKGHGHRKGQCAKN